MTTFVLSEPWMRLLVIGTDCKDSCKSNYHMITTTSRWHINVVKTIITLIEILHLTILWYQEDESILNKKIIAAVSVTTFFVYLLVRYEHDVQDTINILWIAYSCLGISTAFSLPDLIIILLFQVTSFKERIFFIKVQINCQSLTNWVGLLYFWHWKARFVLLLCCRRNSTGQWPEEEVRSCPTFVSSLSEGQKANT